MSDDPPVKLTLITSSPQREEEICLHLEKKRGICTKCGQRARGRPRESHKVRRNIRKRWKRVNGVMTASVFGENMNNCEHLSKLKGICNDCGKNTTGY